jgi:hypothetical protein
VACGYSQVPAFDFNDIFAPVVNDVKFQILLIAMLVWNLKAKIVDVEAAFFTMTSRRNPFWRSLKAWMLLRKTACL